MSYDKTKWIYENDPHNEIRYVLGTVGVKPLLCFGINPSTARPGNKNLDNTCKSVQRLAINNGFDSWIMINIYPQRDKNPDKIHNKIDKTIHQKNLSFIDDILSENQTNNPRIIWAAWGTLITKRPFLIECLIDIHTLSQKYNCTWVSIGKESKFGHPHHPLYLKENEKIKIFGMKSYINTLKNKPAITT